MHAKNSMSRKRAGINFKSSRNNSLDFMKSLCPSYCKHVLKPLSNWALRLSGNSWSKRL